MVFRRLLEKVGLAGAKDSSDSATPDWGKPVGEPLEHKGCIITATPQKDAGGYRVAGIIRPAAPADELPEGVPEDAEHRFVRVDVFPSADAAAELSLMKGKQIVNEQGMRVFNPRPPPPPPPTSAPQGGGQ